jgi:hypothetical protein
VINVDDNSARIFPDRGGVVLEYLDRKTKIITVTCFRDHICATCKQTILKGALAVRATRFTANLYYQHKLCYIIEQEFKEKTQ